MKFNYILNFIISIILYYLFNQFLKLKKSYQSLLNNVNLNSEKINKITLDNNEILNKLNNNLENSDDLEESDNNLHEIFSNFINTNKFQENIENSSESSKVNNDIVDDGSSHDNYLNNEEESKIIVNIDSNEKLSKNSENIEINLDSNEEVAKNSENIDSNSENSNDKINYNLNIDTSPTKYNKSILNKMKLSKLQDIAKDKEIDINYLKNDKTVSKTKKQIIEEILS